jgi:hypothetical protein
MLGYSIIKYEVFTLRCKLSNNVEPQIEIDTKLVKLDELSSLQWKQIKHMQGKIAVSYLKLKYGSPETYLLLAFSKKQLVHIQWIIPAFKMKSRYSFVVDNTYSIISCMTLKKFWGCGVYASQLQKVVLSEIPSEVFWIWAAETNIPSLKGIRKAGASKVAEFFQRKWFWGIITKLDYCSTNNF